MATPTARPKGGDADGIFDSGDVTLTNSTVSGNTNSTDLGGSAFGVFDTGSVSLTDSAATNNTNSANSGTVDARVRESRWHSPAEVSSFEVHATYPV